MLDSSNDLKVLVRITGLCLLVPDPRKAVLDVLLLTHGDDDDSRHNPRLYVETDYIQAAPGTPAPNKIAGTRLSYVDLRGRCIDLSNLAYSPPASSQVKPSNFVADISRLMSLPVDPTCLTAPDPRVAARLKLPPAMFAYTLSPGNWHFGPESNQLANILHCTYPGFSDGTLTLSLQPDGNASKGTWTYSISQNKFWFILEVGNITTAEEPQAKQPPSTINPGDPADDFVAYYDAMEGEPPGPKSIPEWDSAPTEISPAPMRGSFVKCMLAQASP